MSDAAGIRVDAVTVDHRTAAGIVRALDDVTLAVPGASTLAVMGPSGCGKSTLLGLLGGLAQPTRGAVHIGSQVISSLEDRQRTAFRRDTIGYVYQSDNLLPFLTVEENVTLQLARISDQGAARSRSWKLLERMDLLGKAHQLPDELSSGQRQRAAIARAIVHDPKVILADEPTGNLDAENAAVVIDLLLEASEKLEATLVLVTHDVLSAARMDRIVELLDGRVISEDGARHAH